MTPAERIVSYEALTGWLNTLWLRQEDGIIYGFWTLGQDYRVKSKYFGGYPATYLKRVRALYPEEPKCLHLFSGCVDLEEFPGDTVDLDFDLSPTFVDDAQELKTVPLEQYGLVLADPPYSSEDAQHYGPPMINRNRVMRALTRLPAGAHVVFLDQASVMYRKDQWRIIAKIACERSTNHRFRVVKIFERLPSPDTQGL